MNRRGFLTSLGAACFTPSLVSAAGSGASNPFETLLNPETGALYRAEDGVFTLALFMTAGQIYEDCGSAFAGMTQTLAYMRNPEKVRPVLIMPQISDQVDPSNLNNLNRAKLGEVDFTILTGHLTEVLAAAETVDGAFFELDGDGKVSGHTLEAFFMTPSGQVIFHHRADDNITMTGLADRAIAKCESVFFRHLCR